MFQSETSESTLDRLRRIGTMNFLEERILKDGVVKEGNVLKVDSFLNHQMDIDLFDQMGEEFKKRFAGKKINNTYNRSIGNWNCLYCGKTF